MLPAELGRGHRGIYLPFSSFLAAWMAGISWSMGQQGAGAIPRISPWSCSRGLNHGCAAALAPYSWAGGYSFCCFLFSLLPSMSPAAPPARSPAFFTLQEGLCCPGDAGHSRDIPAGKVPRAIPGTSLGDTSVHRGS